MFFLVSGSTSDTDADIAALVLASVDLTIVCPSKFIGLPANASAKTTSLRMNSADDGLIKNSSKSNIFGDSLYKILNNILNDSSVPFD